jgi:ATP-binding cassette subfamily B protein
LRSSDRIVVLREGRIEQDGPPDQLILNDGPYRELIMQEMSRLAKEAA